MPDGNSVVNGPLTKLWIHRRNQGERRMEGLYRQPFALPAIHGWWAKMALWM
jgi:hypothetical protein